MSEMRHSKTFQARLAQVRPGQAIDQLKNQITHTLMDNLKMRQEVQQVSQFVNERKDIINELGTKTTEAHMNRDQLFRDCSTFEENLVKNRNHAIFRDIQQMKDTIGETMGELGDTLRQACEKGGTGWLNEEQQ